MTLLWAILREFWVGSLALQLYVPFTSKYGKGKLTFKLWQRALRRLEERINRAAERGEMFEVDRATVRIMGGPRHWRIETLILPPCFTLVALLPLYFIGSKELVSIASGFSTLYWFWIALLHGDDLITGGDDDKWKKRWSTLKNKVKWQWTPAMEPARAGF